MENWEENKFNKAWQDALGGAEFTPNAQVWDKIDAALLAQENLVMKKRLVFYQRLAAASVAILFLTSAYVFWNSTQSSEGTTPVLANKSNAATTEQPTKIDGSQVAKLSANQSAEVNKGNLNSSEEPQTVPNNETRIPEKYQAQHQVTGRSGANSVTAQSSVESISKGSLQVAVSPISDKNKLKLLSSTVTKLPLIAKPDGLGIAYAVANARPATRTKKRSAASLRDETWAGVALAAGNVVNAPSNLTILQRAFNKQPSAFNLASLKNSGMSEDKLKSTSYSVSVSGGKRVGKRWLLQGGLGYLNILSESSAQYVSATAANFLESRASDSFAPENTNTVTSTTSSTINSNFQFLSIPMQAGYMLIDRKLALQLNGGFSPDIFISSVTSDQNTDSEISAANNSSDTFRPMSLSCTGSLELSYRFSERYRVSLVPGCRYPLTAVYRENSGASAKPLLADIGLRFNYVF